MGNSSNTALFWIGGMAGASLCLHVVNAINSDLDRYEKCRNDAIVEMVDIKTDPRSGHNYVVAKDGDLPKALALCEARRPKWPHKLAHILVRPKPGS